MSTNNKSVTDRLLTKRVAVAVLFFISGFLFASWTSRMPELQIFLNISNTRLGSLLFSMALGAVFAMPTAGWLSTKIGSIGTSRLTAILLCLLVSLLTVSSNLYFVTAFFFGVGFSGGALDVAMNGQAVAVEKNWGKAIMSSFHALFSIGMALGAGAGSIFTKFEMPLPIHFLLVATLSLIASIWASSNLIDDKVSTEDKERNEGGFKLPTMAILPLGVIAFCGMLGEGSMVDWSALYMNKVVGGSEALSALTIGSFATAMTIGRVFGDSITDKLGRVKMLISSSSLAVLGLGFVLVFVSIWTTLIGFFLVGLGLANVVPIIYSAAGNTKGLSPSVGIAMASTIGYTGFFIGPPTIGYLADLGSLRLGFSFTLLVLTVMFVLILTLRRRIQI